MVQNYQGLLKFDKSISDFDLFAFAGAAYQRREDNNVYASVTGAGRDSIGGAVYIGQEA